MGFTSGASLNKRLDAVLAHPESATYAKEFLEDVLRASEKTESQLHRYVLQFFILVFAFEVLLQVGSIEVSFGALTFEDLSVVQKISPLLLAYNYNQVMTWALMREFQAKVVERLFKHLYPVYAQNYFDYAIMPVSMFNFADLMEKVSSGRAKTWISNLSLSLFVISLIGPLLFLAYMFFRLFLVHGLTDLLLWVVFIVVVLLAIYTLLIFSEG